MNLAGEWVRLPEPEPEPEFIENNEPTMAELRQEAHRLNLETEIQREPYKSIEKSPLMGKSP